jgi:hypothetical protein
VRDIRNCCRIAGVLVAVVVVAACSDDAPDDAPAATAAAETPAATAAAATSADVGTTEQNLDPGSGSVPGSPDAADADVVEEVTPLVAEVLAPPRQVLGDDGLIHLAYELFATNSASSTMTIDRLEVLGADGEPVGELTGRSLQAAVKFITDQEEIGPAQFFRVFLDQTFPQDAELPESLAHRFTITLTPSDGGEPTSMPVVTGVTAVDTVDAVVVAAPLRGPGWVVSGGCCFPADYHRTATLPVNGEFHAPERYAIDFVQVDGDGVLFEGAADDLANWGYFGAEVLSVADGTVVRTQDELPEQTPGSFAPGATVSSAGGNFVVVDIGDGNYAFYAHLQPGSLTVEVGDEVAAGDVLGLLGNTGNSDGPHLHFHVMDGPGPLSSNGRPFRFERFDLQGTVTNTVDLLTGVAAEVDDTATGSFEDVMPLNNQLIDFPDASS